VLGDRDDDSGQFSEQYPTSAFLTAVEELDVATTSKIAERIDCSYDLAYRRLNALADDGEINKTDVGGSFIWTLTAH